MIKNYCICSCDLTILEYFCHVKLLNLIVAKYYCILVEESAGWFAMPTLKRLDCRPYSLFSLFRGWSLAGPSSMVENPLLPWPDKYSFAALASSCATD